MFTKFFSKDTSSNVNWKELSDISQLEELDVLSTDQPVLIFKHSTRCPISSMSLNRFERGANESPSFVPFFLDLISYREISNEIAHRYHVQHESPQTILIHKGKAVYSSSHNGISFEKVQEVSSDLI